MKKFMKRTLCLGLVAISLLSVACGGDKRSSGVVSDENVCNIQVYKAGYGVDWLYELKTKFEAAYAEEGYKMNILNPSNDMNGQVVVSMLADGYESNKVDLYITGNVFADTVSKNGQYGELASDIRDGVFNKKAIRYDGTEEDKTVGEKLNPDIYKYLVDQNDTMYAFNWVQCASGIAVNTKKLSQYGLSLPKTTNEMFDCFNKIYLGANGMENSEKSKIFPFASNGYYANASFNVWMAQYDFDAYKTFWTMQQADDEGNLIDLIDNGYEVFQSDCYKEMLKVAYRMFDVNTLCYGAATANLDQTQAMIMKEKNYNAVFMINGDWFLNEVKLNYKDSVGNIEFINTPVISALGVKLFGSGTSYNLDEKQCDELLSYIVGLVDGNKTVAEIVSSVKNEKDIDIAAEDALKVANARGIFYSRGVEHLAYIAKNAKAQKVAELVLRMMASDDFANTFAQLGNGTTPYTTSENTFTKYKFVNQGSKVCTNDYRKIINIELAGFRKRLLLSSMFLTTSNLSTSISTSSSLPSIYDGRGKLNGKDISVYTDSALDFAKAEYDLAKKNWTTWLNR